MKKLCAWCGVMPVKHNKNECCDTSCAASLRWSRMKEKGTIRTFEKASADARQNTKFKRLQAEFERLCKKFDIEPTDSIRRLYIHARNDGYHNGYMTANKTWERKWKQITESRTTETRKELDTEALRSTGS